MGGGASSLRLSDTRVFLLQICSCLKMIYGCRAGKKRNHALMIGLLSSILKMHPILKKTPNLPPPHL